MTRNIENHDDRRPAIGDVINVRGQRARIITVYALGTVDVETETGRCYRVTGLGLWKEAD